MPTDLIQWLTSLSGGELKPFGALLGGVVIVATLFARGTIVLGRHHQEKIEFITKLEGALELCNKTSEERALATYSVKEEFIAFREAQVAAREERLSGGTPA